MDKQDQLSDAQRNYIDSIRGGIPSRDGIFGSLTSKEFAYALDSYLNNTPVATVVERILADRHLVDDGKHVDDTLH